MAGIQNTVKGIKLRYFSANCQFLQIQQNLCCFKYIFQDNSLLLTKRLLCDVCVEKLQVSVVIRRVDLICPEAHCLCNIMFDSPTPLPVLVTQPYYAHWCIADTFTEEACNNLCVLFFLSLQFFFPLQSLIQYHIAVVNVASKVILDVM